jgi:hypothetical protein
MVACLETPSLANSKWDYSPCLSCSNPSFLLQGLTNTNTTSAYCVENKILTSKAHVFLQTHLTQASHPFVLHSSTLTVSLSALTRSPNSKANPPTTPCIKATKQMATYVATPDHFDAPFDAMQNAVLPFKHSSLYIAMPNTSANTETTKIKSSKKSSEPAPTRVQRAPITLTAHCH